MVNTYAGWPVRLTPGFHMFNMCADQLTQHALTTSADQLSGSCDRQSATFMYISHVVHV